TNSIQFSTISILPATAGTTWYLSFNLAVSTKAVFSNVQVQNSSAIASVMQSDYRSTDLGGNTNWVFSPFDPNQIDVDGPNGGLFGGGSAWGDFDNDGDL